MLAFRIEMDSQLAVNLMDCPFSSKYLIEGRYDTSL